jgi:streptogramin lyase
VKQARRDRWLVAAGVVVMLVALVVVGRLQAGNLAEGDAGGSQPTTSTVRTDATPVASGLAVAGRVVLPSPAAAVAVGEDAIWVLLEQGALLRVDPDRHRMTGRLELEAPTGGMPAGPLAVGAGAVWVGTRGATVTVRVDPVRLRVTGRLAARVAAVAGGVVWSYCCRRGDDFMGFGRVDARRLRPRPPLVVTDVAGRRQPVGWLARGPEAVWTVAFGHQRLWRVPLGGGPARPIFRVGDFLYGLAAHAGRVWVLSGSDDPGRQRDWTLRLRRLDQRRGEVTATIPLPQLEVGGFRGPLGLAPAVGAVWVAGPVSGGLQGGGILLRIDPASGRVAGWLRDPLGFVPGVLAAGPGGAWVGTGAPALLHVVAA